MISNLVFLCGIYLLIESVQSAKWSYTGATGPGNWSSLFPHACAGSKQSPIDIKSEQTMYSPALKDFAIYYDPPKPDSKMYVKNNGHTAQVDLVGDFYVSNGGLQNLYKAVQFHFHWGHKHQHGSEHLIDGTASPIEMHIVSYNTDVYNNIGEAVTEQGGLAVLGVMFEIGSENNPAFEDIIKGLKHVRDPESRSRISLPVMSLRDLLPKDITRYYRYNGSLTTPGCFESVIWTVFDQKQTISHHQLREFRALLQFRHKKSHNRHKRSKLTLAQRRLEKEADTLFNELGIQDEEYEKALVRSKLIENKQKEMLKDMPHGHHGSHERKSHDAKEANKVHYAEEETPNVEHEYTQDLLVNNFRPAQPVNGRIILRSFKLRESRHEEEKEVHMGQSVHHNEDQHGHHHTSHDNASSCLHFNIFMTCTYLFYHFL